VLTFISITLCLYQFINAQITIGMRIKFHDSIITAKYVPDSNGFKYKFILIDPGDYRITNTAATTILNQETITQIDLVYTYFPQVMILMS